MINIKKLSNPLELRQRMNPTKDCLYGFGFVLLLSGSGSFRESPRPSGQDPNLWTVEEVMQYIRDIDPVLAPHADLFRKHVCFHSVWYFR